MHEPNSSDDADLDVLTTLTVTVRERIQLQRCVVMATAMVDALGDDVQHLMALAERVQPEGREWA